MIGQSVIQGETTARELRARMLDAIIAGEAALDPIWVIVESLRDIAGEFVPDLADGFWESDLAAWIDAYQWNAGKLPQWLKTQLSEVGGTPPPPPIINLFGDPVPPEVKFPKIENAAKSLEARGIMTRAEFDQVSDAAKSKAFTIAGEIENETIDRIRNELVKATVEGPSLPKFRETLEKKLNTGLLGPAHIETVYRTNLQAAYRDGRESLLRNPIVGEAFPYQEYLPIHDARARPEHRILESLGLNGTGIYRRDDPFWNRFTPPWDYNCRCATNLLSIEAAARGGVKEAQKWLETGVPPQQPEFRDAFIPFDNVPGFGQRTGVLIA